MRRLTLFFLCWFGAALLMAAGSAFAEPDKTTIVYSHLSNVGPLNPHMYSPNQMFAQTMVYEALVRLETDGSIAPSLAERWDISPDGTRYTFFLRKDVTFSDGQPFDAHAVEKNFRAILGNAKRHQWLGIT
ncbi:ABC transporter substrate-binding protein, partial [Desulfosarcina sp. OttesenSCG-928-G17]|nr:ABC transporter substrate-binding protein [Desulfosarcina sp. OttesenSCG-928-G17]